MMGRLDIGELTGRRVLAVGDIMLDRYEYGSVERISPEAPVPVFKPVRTKNMLGGVGNVAANLVALGCSVDLVARTGVDKDGRLIARMLSGIGVNASFMRQDGVSTIVKTRLIAGNSHLLRIDTESVLGLDAGLADLAYATCLGFLDAADIVLLSDYSKGFLTERLCRAIITESKKRGKKVVVDPKGVDYGKYTGAFLVKPNLKELGLATRRTFDPQSTDFLADVERTARSLAGRIGVGGLLVTLSEHGMLYAPASKSRKSVYLPTNAREVYDVSGAGDTALAALGAALGAGFDMPQSMRIANAASSVVVSKLGTATASLEEVGMALSESTVGTVMRKIVTYDSIVDVVKWHRRQGKTIGFTNGCFDCCHLGHLHSLQEAKSLCDVLVVGVNSDKWIRRHKGLGRPIQDQKTRSALLASLSCVDYVVVFEDETALPLVRLLRPDVIAKEGYALKDWPEGRFVRSIGGAVISLKRLDGYSTTKLAEKMRCS